MTEIHSPESGMGRKFELQTDLSHATVRPNAEVTHLHLNGQTIFFGATKLRTLSAPKHKDTNSDEIADTNIEGGSFVAWPFGRKAFDYLRNNPAIHGVGALLHQWKVIPVRAELRSSVVALEKQGGTYFEQAFGSDNYSLLRAVALTNTEGTNHAILSTTVMYSGNEKDDAQGQFYPLAEHSYYTVESYESACVALRDKTGVIQIKPLKSFESPNKKGEMVLDSDCANEMVEIEPGTVWLLPDGPKGRVVVIKRSIAFQKADGSVASEPVSSHWVLYHKMDSEHTNPAAVAIEPVAGDFDAPTRLLAGDRVTQTVDISTAESLDALRVAEI
ncbi:MAG TPA: hypothetical protein VFQ63_01980 [Patescibacteria group bacterium]|nr:hypothetical protein [Patescibacteria group bacterium]